MSQSPFAIRGVVEGFYGAFYTPPERDDLIRFIGQQGYNLYLYGPKNDRQHRARWREAYPEKVMEQFAQTIQTADENGVAFAYAISPGLTMCYSSPEDFEAITSKFRAFYELGTRTFCVMLDDIASEFSHESDRTRYRTYAEAHVDLCNRVYDWLQALDPANTLSMCPTDYHGKPPFSTYLHELGSGLNPAIDVFYTGTEICSTSITTADAAAFAQAVARKPIIWDNYPVNDLAMQGKLHLAPVRDREATLYETVKGFAINPMLQAEASKVALYTFGCYFRNPQQYDPEHCWQEALSTVAGDAAPALRLLADNSIYAATGQPEYDQLQRLVEAALTSLQNGDTSIDNPAVEMLLAYLTEIDEAGYQLEFGMDNYALRNNILPWVELLESWIWAARYGIWALQSHERGEDYAQSLNMLRECDDAAQQHHKQSGGAVLRPLINTVFDRLSPREPEYE